MKKEESCGIKTSIGGQALMEGIMMRGPKKSAMAVRNPKGEMVLEEWDTKGNNRKKFFKLPFIRGMFNFADSMIIGYKCLMKSAKISGLDEIEEEERKAKEIKKAAKAAKKAAKKGSLAVEAEPCCKEESAETAGKCCENTEENTEAVREEFKEEPIEKAAEEVKGTKEEHKEEKEKKSSASMTIITVLSVLLSVALVVGLFIWLPTFLYMQLGKVVPAMNPENRYLKSVFEGVLKVLMLVGYMAAVSRMKDIHRTFMYHGAEHKTIFCYEHGLELTVENVRIQRRFHPRCGTSFLVFMVLIGILISFLIPPTLSTAVRTLIKIALIPVIMGIGYELIKFAGRHDNLLTRIISAPGMWLQHITTAEPDDSMIECAIAAMNKVIPDDGSDRIP